jgi:UDP-GlcNAc:undecaprenyl-phosphate GlcNAc-1-phosphate transferase
VVLPPPPGRSPNLPAVQFPLWAHIAVGIGLAAAVAYFVTPVAIVAARRFAFYDRPAGYKGHAAPTPYLGGAAVMLAFALALVLAAGDLRHSWPLLAGVVLLSIVGTIDDRRTVSPHLRVLIEFALGAAVALAGLGWHLGAGTAVDAVLNGVWVVAVVNAFNLFDNMDGAASTMAVVVAGGACVLAVLTGARWVTLGSAALCGACIGFLPHNLARPARIFLGDGGSMPLGFVAAVLVASAARSAEPSTLALLTGFLLVGIPALDTCLVVVSRRRRGVSILTGGQDHLTHRTRQRIGAARNVALVLGSVQALVSGLVIVATRSSSTTLVYIVLAFVVCAVTAIVGLDEVAPASPSVSGEGPLAAPSRLRSLRESRWRDYGATAAVAVLGLGAGISPFFSAYYDAGVWVPIGLALTVAAAIAAIARAPQARSPMVLVLIGVAGLGIWSLISAGWAQNAEAATVEGNRWLSYAALLLLLIVLLRTSRRAHVLLIAAGIGIAVVGASILVRMLGSAPGDLFVSGRLYGPLAYVNGEGCVFAMACWGGVALAERREALLAGLGAATTVIMAGLALLSQSRGAAVAIVVSAVVVFVAVPGLRRRVVALAVITGGFVAAAGPVLHVYSAAGTNHLTAAVIHRGASAILLSAAVTGIVWGSIVWLSGRVRLSHPQSVVASRLVTGLVVVLLAAPFVAGIVRSSAIGHTVRTQWNAFVHLSDANPTTGATTQTRLFSGAGDRYDYWRIAWNGFRAHPIGGLGAGNYPALYYQQRRTTETIQNPHSFVLQTLAELGIVGLLLVGLVVAGTVLGVWRLRRFAVESAAARTVMVVATGAAVVWFVDSSGDWMQLLPGVAALALAAVAALCTQAGHLQTVSRAPQTGMQRISALVGIAAIAIVLAIGGGDLARTELGTLYLDNAHRELGSKPGAAIRDANRVLRLDGANLDAYYVKAAAQARLNDAPGARATLFAAVREDPVSFVTWTLLGDLEVRLRNFSEAKSFYARAYALDPLEPGLAGLASNPASALTGGG